MKSSSHLPSSSKQNTTSTTRYESLDDLIKTPTTQRTAATTTTTLPLHCEIEPLGFLYKTPRKVYHNGKEKFSSPVHRFAGVLMRKFSSGDLVWSERLFHLVRPRTCPRLLRYALNLLEDSELGCTSAYFDTPTSSLRLPRRWSVKSNTKLPKRYSGEKDWIKSASRRVRKKSLTHKISSGIKAFKMSEVSTTTPTSDNNDWTLTWHEVSSKDSELRSLYNYVLRMSHFYDPKRRFPCDSFGNDWDTKECFDIVKNLKWAQRVQVQKILNNGENREYICSNFGKVSKTTTITVPWYQIIAVLDKKGILNNRVVKHNQVQVGDFILIVKCLVKEMAWTGTVCDSKKDVKISNMSMGKEFDDDKEVDLEYAIVHDKKERIWIESLKIFISFSLSLSLFTSTHTHTHTHRVVRVQIEKDGLFTYWVNRTKLWLVSLSPLITHTHTHTHTSNRYTCVCLRYGVHSKQKCSTLVL